MTEPTWALQKLIHSRLISAPAVTALVDTSRIVDSNQRPGSEPLIIIGSGNAVYEDRYDRFHDQCYADLHVWTQEEGFETSKAIVGAIRSALRERPWETEGFTCHGLSIGMVRFLRDPNGTHTHAVIGIDAVVQEAA